MEKRLLLFYLFHLVVQIIAKQSPAVFILMTINAEVLPVGSVRGIVTAVSVFMVDCEEMACFEIELPAALCAYEPVDFE